MAGAWAPEDICQSALAEPQRPQQSLLRRKVLMICVECVCVRACVCVCVCTCMRMCMHKCVLFEKTQQTQTCPLIWRWSCPSFL